MPRPWKTAIIADIIIMGCPVQRATGKIVYIHVKTLFGEGLSGNPFLCKKGFPGPLPKNSKLVLANQSISFGLIPLADLPSIPGPNRSGPKDCAGQRLLDEQTIADTLCAASHIRVFGVGSGEGLFAKRPSPAYPPKNLIRAACPLYCVLLCGRESSPGLV